MSLDSDRRLREVKSSTTPQRRLYDLVRKTAAGNPDKFGVDSAVNDCHGLLAATTSARQPDGTCLNIRLSVNQCPGNRLEEVILVKLNDEPIYRLDATRGDDARENYEITAQLVKELTGKTDVDPEILLRNFVLGPDGELTELSDKRPATKIGAEEAIGLLEAAASFELPPGFGPTVTLKNLWGRMRESGEGQSGLGLMLLSTLGEQK